MLLYFGEAKQRLISVTFIDATFSGCFGLHCKNNGTLEQTDGQCLCMCADGYSGIYCEYRKLW